MTQCHGVRCCTDQKTFMSVDIVAAHYGWLISRATVLPLEYWTHFKTFLCTSTYTWHEKKRKNVHIVNDSTVRQCHMDHRRSWVRRPSWGWRASTRRILNDGCSRAYQMAVYISYIVIEMCRDLTYTTKKRWVYLIAIRRRWDDSMSW